MGIPSHTVFVNFAKKNPFDQNDKNIVPVVMSWFWNRFGRGVLIIHSGSVVVIISCMMDQKYPFPVCSQRRTKPSIQILSLIQTLVAAITVNGLSVVCLFNRYDRNIPKDIHNVLSHSRCT